MDLEREDKQDEFDLFLSKVKEVRSIINDMSSSDIEISKQGLENAGKYLLNSAKEHEKTAPDEDGIVTVYSRSSLNRKALEEISVQPDFSGMGPEEFKAAVERDAKERYNRRN